LTKEGEEEATGYSIHASNTVKGITSDSIRVWPSVSTTSRSWSSNVAAIIDDHPYRCLSVKKQKEKKRKEKKRKDRENQHRRRKKEKKEKRVVPAASYV